VCLCRVQKVIVVGHAVGVLLVVDSLVLLMLQEGLLAGSRMAGAQAAAGAWQHWR
jgi:hypothetical protein